MVSPAATVASLAELVGGTVIGDADLPIRDLAGLDRAGPEHLSFFANPKYRDQLFSTRAAAVLVREQVEGVGCTQICCADPYLAMARIAVALHPPPEREPGVEPGAHVHPTASVDARAVIRAGAIVDEGASIGPGTVVDCGATVGAHATIGEDCVLHSGSRVLDRCILGARVILQAGAVIGSDGFGYAPDARGRRHKIPQVGIVVLEDDVEIGANSTVDRATFGETRIGRGTKVDNLVQVAHNVELGEDCVVVSQSGIAGSTRVGNRVIMGARVGIAGHVTIAGDVMLGAGTGVAGDIDAPGIYSGIPAIEHRQWLKAAMSFRHLPELRRRVRALEKTLDDLDEARPDAAEQE